MSILKHFRHFEYLHLHLEFCSRQQHQLRLLRNLLSKSLEAEYRNFSQFSNGSYSLAYGNGALMRFNEKTGLTVRISTLTYVSVQGSIQNRPGPTAPSALFFKRPKRNITARSYSVTILIPAARAKYFFK